MLTTEQQIKDEIEYYNSEFANIDFTKQCTIVVSDGTNKTKYINVASRSINAFLQSLGYKTN